MIMEPITAACARTGMDFAASHTESLWEMSRALLFSVLVASGYIRPLFL